MSGRQAIASIGAFLGSALAKTKKKKNTAPKQARVQKIKKKRRAQENGSQLMPRRSMSTIMAPIGMGVVTSNSGRRHKPFVLSGRGMCSQITTTASQPTLTGPAGGIVGVSSCVTFDVDVAGNGVIPTNFQLFPAQIYSLSTIFLRYRFRRLIFTYVPSCSTQVSGMVLMCSTPEAMSSTNVGPSNLGASTVANAVTGPMWTTVTLDAMKNGLNTGWLYCDTATTLLQPTLRQETAGSLSFAMFNQSANAVYGTLWVDYEIEFDDLANNTDYGSATSSVPLNPPTPLIEEAKEIESERYVQVLPTQPCTHMSVPPTPAVSGWFQPGAANSPPRLQ
jgi:hypothetical protein